VQLPFSNRHHMCSNAKRRDSCVTPCSRIISLTRGALHCFIFPEQLMIRAGHLLARAHGAARPVADCLVSCKVQSMIVNPLSAIHESRAHTFTTKLPERAPAGPFVAESSPPVFVKSSSFALASTTALPAVASGPASAPSTEMAAESSSGSSGGGFWGVISSIVTETATNTLQYVRNPAAAKLAALKRDAEGGHRRAQFHLGTCFLRGDLGAPVDPPQALVWLLRAAEQGHPHAQNDVGALYYSGNGLPTRDIDAALYWFSRAAEQDHPDALAALGDMYLLGDGVTIDLERARRYLERAAELDVPLAQIKWVTLLQEHGREGGLFAPISTQEAALARRVLDRAGSRDDHPEVQLAAALLMRERCPVLGIRQNLELSFNLLRGVADSGHPVAAAHVGECYYNGRGAPLDHQAAAAFFRHSAEAGYPGGLYGLALMTRLGQGGLEEDRARARELFQRAADENHLDALFDLGEMVIEDVFVAAEAASLIASHDSGENADGNNDNSGSNDGGDGAPLNLLDLREAVAYFRRGIELGSVDCAAQLGGMLYDGAGIGAERDDEEAVRLLTLAAEQGHEGAQESLEVIRRDREATASGAAAAPLRRDGKSE